MHTHPIPVSSHVCVASEPMASDPVVPGLGQAAAAAYAATVQQPQTNANGKRPADAADLDPQQQQAPVAKRPETAEGGTAAPQTMTPEMIAMVTKLASEQVARLQQLQQQQQQQAPPAQTPPPPRDPTGRFAKADDPPAMDAVSQQQPIVTAADIAELKELREIRRLMLLEERKEAEAGLANLQEIAKLPEANGLSPELLKAMANKAFMESDDGRKMLISASKMQIKPTASAAAASSAMQVESSSSWVSSQQQQQQQRTPVVSTPTGYYSAASVHPAPQRAQPMAQVPLIKGRDAVEEFYERECAKQVWTFKENAKARGANIAFAADLRSAAPSDAIVVCASAAQRATAEPLMALLQQGADETIARIQHMTAHAPATTVFSRADYNLRKTDKINLMDD